jgi:hypothetical protein
MSIVVALACAAQFAGSARATTCADGSYSSSTGPGTCSHHGWVASGGSIPTPTAGDKDCPDFATQADAQAYFVAHGGSVTNSVDDLDAAIPRVLARATPRMCPDVGLVLQRGAVAGRISI